MGRRATADVAAAAASIANPRATQAGPHAVIESDGACVTTACSSRRIVAFGAEPFNDEHTIVGAKKTMLSSVLKGGLQ